MFDTIEESNKHIEKDHQDGGCKSCDCMSEEVKELKKLLQEKNDIIEKLAEKNEYVTKKNVDVDKELRRMNQAFNESIYEKEKFRKQVNDQNESINEVIKQNSILNEDLKVKTNLIKLLRTTTSNSQQDDEPGKEAENLNDANKNTKEVITLDDYHKCNKCEYKTNVKVHL